MDWILLCAALFLAFNNGANDNFKGFATVWGADALSYRHALALATVATLAGSLASWLLADTLVQQFSGRGLVPHAITSTPHFILSVASGAAITVFLATRLGLPISTTHALIGGLVGAGLGQAGGAVDFSKLVQTFFIPLLLSPLLAAGLGVCLYKLLKLRRQQNDCICAVPTPAAAVASASLQYVAHTAALPQIVISSNAACNNVPVLGRWSIQNSLNTIHIGSAATICFARAVNDTPKLAALLIAAKMTPSSGSIVLIGIFMCIGGLLFAKKVAETMGKKINRLDDTQGLTANLITATLVLLASKLGLPVSTTHVSVGAIAGVGASAGTLNWQSLRHILLSWIATLPLALTTAWLVSQVIQ